MSTDHPPSDSSGRTKAAYQKLSPGATGTVTRGDGIAPSKLQDESANIVTAFSQLLGKPYEPMFQVDTSPKPARQQLSKIPHYSQLDTWDCGVACIQMVLRWLRPDEYWPRNDCVRPSADEMAERKWMIDSAETESVWTIDIVIILQRVFDTDQRRMFDFPLGQRHDDENWEKANYVFFSKKLGCDVAYSQFGYYSKAFDNDETRVKKRFVLAKELNLPVLCVSQLDLEFVIDLVSRDECIAIVLLDNEILKQADEEYTGHYVLLVGISSDKTDIAHAEAKCNEGMGSEFCLAIKDPAHKDCIVYVTPTLFERAWRASGTDEDIIFIAKR